MSKPGWFFDAFFPRRRFPGLPFRRGQLLQQDREILIARGYLFLRMVPAGQLPLHDRQLVRQPCALQALGNRLLAGLDLRIPELGQLLSI
jgi:hypothetical protein